MTLAEELAAFLKKEEHGQSFTSRYWKQPLRFREEYQAHEGKILRRHVFERARQDLARGVEWSIVWGFPMGKQVGTFNLQPAIQNLDPLIDTVARLRAGVPDAGEALLALNKAIPHISTAVTTKVAYFCGIVTEQGPALIMDSQAWTALFSRADPEFGALLASPPISKTDGKTRRARIGAAISSNQAYPTYREYVRHLNEVANRLGVAPGDLERFLFVEGQEINKAEGKVKRAATRAAKKALSAGS